MPIIFSSSLFGQPPQAIPSPDKDEEWKKRNMDWMEQFFQAELALKQNKLLKNYNMAQGVIDINDYIKLDNEYKSVYDSIQGEISDALLEDSIEEELHFYPIVPSIINVLLGELLKKFDHIKVKAIDEYSSNEAQEYKKQLVVQYLQQKANEKIAQQLATQGVKQDSPEYQQQFQQAQQQAMSLPEIQTFMNRKYKNNYEDWADKILERAIFKYKLPEKEPEIFKHQLIGDEAYWHIRIMDNDLDVEVWNPKETICLKSDHHKYTSYSDLIGRQYWSTVGNVVMQYKNKLPNELIEKYNSPLGVASAISDNRPSPEDKLSGLQTEKLLLGFKQLFNNKNIDTTTKVQITEGYWMSQRRLAKLTAIYEGVKVEKIVDDTFVVTIPPEYDEEKNLIAGEELEYFYAPQYWKGTKLNFGYGTTPTSFFDENKYLQESIYKKTKKSKEDDIEKGVWYVDVQPVEYQFSDKLNPFMPKCPVIGCNGFEPTMNVGKLSLVDKTKAHQVIFNSMWNQIDNFCRTEVGLFFMLDQKLIPRHSIDGEWDKNNWMKFLSVAHQTGLGIVDNSIINTEGQQTYAQPTVVNLLKNEQIKSRLDVALAAKLALFESIGVTPQRMGTTSSEETATGIEQAKSASYAQTEIYYTNHSNLMREFKEMLLDAEKYIESKKPISRVQYLNSEVENVMFEIDTEDLLLRRYDVYLTSNPDSQRILEQLRQLAIQNNTSGATMADLAVIIESNNTREIKDTLQQSVANMQAQEQQKQQHEKELQQQQLQAQAEETQRQRDWDADQNERDRIKDMFVAEAKSLGQNKNNDLDQNQIADSLEIEKFNLEQGKHYATILDNQSERISKSQELQQKNSLELTKADLKRSEIDAKVKIEEQKLKVERENMKNDISVAKINSSNRAKKK